MIVYLIDLPDLFACFCLFSFSCFSSQAISVDSKEMVVHFVRAADGAVVETTGIRK